METQPNEINKEEETQETEGGSIRFSKVISNKNFIIGKIYNLTSDVTELRVNVTSPAGTTAAALEVLMDRETGFPPLMKRAVAAAANRGRELGKT